MLSCFEAIFVLKREEAEGRRLKSWTLYHFEVIWETDHIIFDTFKVTGEFPDHFEAILRLLGLVCMCTTVVPCIGMKHLCKSDFN